MNREIKLETKIKLVIRDNVKLRRMVRAAVVSLENDGLHDQAICAMSLLRELKIIEGAMKK